VYTRLSHTKIFTNPSPHIGCDMAEGCKEGGEALGDYYYSGTYSFDIELAPNRA